jgi:hypothetical protein
MEKWTKLINRIRQEITLKPIFLHTRQDAENEAMKLLDKKAGAFSTKDLYKFLDLCNTEIVPPDINSAIFRKKVTRTRFQLSFIGQNRQLMIGALDMCNKWIHVLWSHPGEPFDILSQFWNISEVPGAGIGLPTMILYLKKPEEFNIWLPFLNDACNLITKKDLSCARNAKYYKQYNNAINEELRNPYGLKPQEIDYILYRIKSEMQTNKT